MLKAQMPEMLQGDWRRNPNIMEWARQRADYNLKAADPSRPHRHPYAPTFLYDEALRPILPYGIKGVAWYQGESNADLPQVHARLFPMLERCWREAFGQPDLPVPHGPAVEHRHSRHLARIQKQSALAG